MEKARAGRLSGHVLCLMGLFAALAIGGMALVVYTSIIRSDEASLTWQRQLVERAMAEQVAAISRDQESVTFWDDAVLEVERRNIGWLHENLGEWMFHYFGHDRVFVLDPAGEPIYAMRDGEADSSPSVGDVLAILAPHTGALLARLAAADEATVERATLLIDGRPALTSAMPILPHSERLEVLPGTEHLLVSVQYLDRIFLAGLQDEYGLADARIVVEGAPSAALARLPVAGTDGRPIAWLVWNPNLPGRQVLGTIVPMAVGTGIALVTFVGFFARHVYRTSAALEASEARALHLAYHDTLTGLPNRAQLVVELDRALSPAEAQPAALLMVDLDRFKEVNDSFGHQAGDEVIRAFASRVAADVRRNDMIARLGGDEFAILLAGRASSDDLVSRCERVLDCARQPFEITGGKATIGVSIGYAMLEPGLDRGEVMRRADIALYAAKRAGRNGYSAFTDDMDAAVQARHQVEQELRAALAAGGGGLSVDYQPVVNGRDGTISGVEALVRWNNVRLGTLSPATFVPIAEESGLIDTLDEWVLRTACREARQWAGLSLAVNVSPRSFEKKGLARRMLAVLEETDFDPTMLEVEVTEGILLDDEVDVAAELHLLRANGVRIVLDDFGTGYSSLGTLQIDKVKVDRSFIQHLGQGTEATAIVDAVIELGRSSNMTVTAEGVETELQRDYLLTAGCDEVQGFLYSQPLAASAMTAFLAAQAEPPKKPQRRRCRSERLVDQHQR